MLPWLHISSRVVQGANGHGFRYVLEMSLLLKSRERAHCLAGRKVTGKVDAKGLLMDALFWPIDNLELRPGNEKF